MAALTTRPTLAYEPFGHTRLHRCRPGQRAGGSGKGLFGSAQLGVLNATPKAQGNGYRARMPQPPSLTPGQRQAALEKAAEARRARAELKEKLKTGAVVLAEVIEATPTDEVIAKTRVLAVLESLPGVGKVKARRTMRDIGISESRKMKGLGDQQRAALLETFPPR